MVQGDDRGSSLSLARRWSLFIFGDGIKNWRQDSFSRFRTMSDKIFWLFSYSLRSPTFLDQFSTSSQFLLRSVWCCLSCSCSEALVAAVLALKGHLWCLCTCNGFVVGVVGGRISPQVFLRVIAVGNWLFLWIYKTGILSQHLFNHGINFASQNPWQKIHRENDHIIVICLSIKPTWCIKR